MSEYQYYEFAAVDAPVPRAAQTELRRMSSRASISSTSFVNTYDFGDFRGNPLSMMKYFDLHVHVTNWGTNRFMIAVPLSSLPLSAVRDFAFDPYATMTPLGRRLVLDFSSEVNSLDVFDQTGEGILAALSGIRTELLGGDLRPLYIAWLAAVATAVREVDEVENADHLEPPVPPGLTDLTGPQQALSEFLRLDSDMLTAAAECSSRPARRSAAAVRASIAELSESAKNKLFYDVARGRHATVHKQLSELGSADASAETKRRTVGELLDRVAHVRASSRSRSR